MRDRFRGKASLLVLVLAWGVLPGCRMHRLDSPPADVTSQDSYVPPPPSVGNYVDLPCSKAGVKLQNLQFYRSIGDHPATTAPEGEIFAMALLEWRLPGTQVEVTPTEPWFRIPKLPSPGPDPAGERPELPASGPTDSPPDFAPEAKETLRAPEAPWSPDEAGPVELRTGENAVHPRSLEGEAAYLSLRHEFPLREPREGFIQDVRVYRLSPAHAASGVRLEIHPPDCPEPLVFVLGRYRVE